MSAADKSIMAEIAAMDIDYGDCPGHMKPVHAAGEWLHARMVAEGATDDEANRACFAMGQRIRMKGIKAAYQVAEACLARWRRGIGDMPGRAFGHALIDGDINE
jgi:hypothetical protein